MTEKGGYFHEPPSTWEEEMDLYRRMGGAKSLTIVHRSPAPTAAPTRHPQKLPGPDSYS
jgi:hypothetical protein